MNQDYRNNSNKLIRDKYLAYAGYLILALIVTAIGAFVGMTFHLHPFILIILFIVEMIFFQATNGGLKKIIFYLFCASEGLIVSTSIKYYLHIDTSIIYEAIIVTMLVTVLSLFIGYIARDLSGLRLPLTVALIVLFILTIVSLFVYMPFLTYLLAALFAIYIAYDINCYKRLLQSTNGNITTDEILHHVMQQQVNITALFIEILDIVGRD